MNLHRIAIAAFCLALFGLMAVPHSAQAQQQGAQEQDSLTYESLVSALDDLETQTQTLGQLDAQNVRVVDVENVVSNLDDAQRQRLRDMYENVDTEALQGAIENSPTIIDALQSETGTQYGASDVVAIDMQDGGQIVAYVDPNNTMRGTETDDLQQREDEWQDRDTTAAGDMQRDDQQQDQDPFETAEPQQQDPQTYEHLHSLLTDIEARTQALDRMDAQPTEDQPTDEQRTDTQSIRVINVEDITADLDDTQLQRLRRSYQDADTEQLRSAVENNEAIKNALQSNTTTQVDASDVVAIDVQEQGETVVYVDPNDELKGQGTGDMQQQEDEWQDRDTTAAGDMQQQDGQQQDQEPMDTGEAGQQAAETFERIHSAMHEIKTQTQALTETGDQRIRVVHVEDVISDLDDTQVQRLQRTHENAETDELHSAVENNEAIKNALQNNTTAQVTASDVVAIDVQQRGETVVYVDPNDELKDRGMGETQQREDEWQDADTSEIGGRQQRDAQQRGRDSSRTQEFEQQEDRERDRDTSQAGEFEQTEAQRRDRNTQETGDVQQQEAQQQDPESYESLYSALNDIKTQMKTLTGMGDDERRDGQGVRVVNVEDITGDLDETQLQRLQRSYQNADTNELRRTLENNEAIKNALKTEADTQVDASDVVAVDVRETGETVVYVDPNGELEGDGTGDIE